MVIERSDLENLVASRSLPCSIQGFQHIADCGFRFDSYIEIAVCMNDHHMYWPFGELDTVRFRIESAEVELALCSGLWQLLLGPYYEESDWGQEDFGQNLPTIRIAGHGNIDYMSSIISAIYYLNSYYLADADICVDVCHLTPAFTPLEFAIDEFGKAKLNQKRLVVRPVLRCRDAALLFNRAANSTYESRFLNYYRTVEYFTTQEVIDEINRLRHDTKVDTKELIRMIGKKGECDSLRVLLNRRLTPSMRGRFANYAYYKKLIKKNSFDALVDGLYEYRCSIVHAKEAMLDRTSIPDPFAADHRMTAWTFLMRKIAVRVVAVMNQ